MARQRNNITRLDYDQRELVRDWLANGLFYNEIRSRLAPILKGGDNEKLAFHNTTFKAYQKSDEYKNYLEQRRQVNARIQPKRMLAALINSGKGIESAADVAAMELLEQIQQLSGAGLEVKDIQKLAAAAVALKRSSSSAKEKALHAELEKEKALRKAEVEELTNEIAELRATKEKGPGGLSEEALRKIKEQARIM